MNTHCCPGLGCQWCRSPQISQRCESESEAEVMKSLLWKLFHDTSYNGMFIEFQCWPLGLPQFPNPQVGSVRLIYVLYLCPLPSPRGSQGSHHKIRVLSLVLWKPPPPPPTFPRTLLTSI